MDGYLVPSSNDTAMSFQQNKRLAWVMQTAGCDYGQALRLIDLYDLIAYIKFAGKDASLNWLASNRGTTWASIRRNATLMQKLGWLSFRTVDAVGTEWELHLDTSNTTTEPPSATTTEPPSATTAEEASDTTAEEASDAVLVHKIFLDNKKEKKKETNEREGSPTSVFRGSSLKDKTVKRWNELKPKNFKSISSISPSRDRSIRALGGYQVFIDLLPAFFAGVKLNKFWAKTPGMSFENILGTGPVPKGHFIELSEAGQDSNLNITPRSLQHPDFFPPVGKFADMRAKHNNFVDEADAQRREDEAREFYAQQEASK